MRRAERDEVRLERVPAIKPPAMLAIPIAANTQAVRLGTFSKVAKAGTATSKIPQPKPMKEPSSINSRRAGLRQSACWPLSLTSGIQLRETFDIMIQVPPIKIMAEVTASALPGWADRASVVAITGPITPAVFIMEVSIAYAVRS